MNFGSIICLLNPDFLIFNYGYFLYLRKSNFI